MTPSDLRQTLPDVSAPWVLMDDRLAPGERGLLFHDAADIVVCHEAEDLEHAFERIGQASRDGLYVAGWCAYEAGHAFEARLAPLMRRHDDQPLLWFGVFRHCEVLDGRGMSAFLDGRMACGHRLERVAFGLDEAPYCGAIERILEYIRAGDVYQVNFTFPAHLEMWGDPVSLYAALRARQTVAHGALIDTGSDVVLSLSPELFFERSGEVIRTRPMKGTAARGRDEAEDETIRAWLKADAKSRAENLMIVDLLRNDLGRVADVGSIHVPDLFTVETYPTFHGMTSTIEGRLTAGLSIGGLMRALFPCGSVTGAPKIRAMEIIRELEGGARGAYTGSVGHVLPDGRVSFNVAIRTLVLKRNGGNRLSGVMGVGSGIVADSDPQAEYEECRLKAAFLTREAEPFALIETMRAQGASIPLLERHVSRLAASARWYGMPFDETVWRHRLEEALAGQPETASARVRATLSTEGDVSVTVTPLSEMSSDWPLRVVLSPLRIDAADPRYRHKTTRRDLYNSEHDRVTGAGAADEVVFLNTWGEVAEGSRSTIFVERDGRLLTPPVACGALPGVARAWAFKAADRPVEEAVLRLEDLRGADRLFLSNAVWGLRRARLVPGIEAGPGSEAGAV